MIEYTSHIKLTYFLLNLLLFSLALMINYFSFTHLGSLSGKMMFIISWKIIWT